MSLIVAV